MENMPSCKPKRIDSWKVLRSSIGVSYGNFTALQNNDSLLRMRDYKSLLVLGQSTLL